MPARGEGRLRLCGAGVPSERGGWKAGHGEPKPARRRSTAPRHQPMSGMSCNDLPAVPIAFRQTASMCGSIDLSS